MAQSRFCYGALCFGVMFGFCMAMGILATRRYLHKKDIVADLRWTVCNTTSFSIDPTTFDGILTIESQHPSKCVWNQVTFFSCAGPSSSQCLRDNTNRFNNHAWSCIIHIVPGNEAQTLCDTIVWSDWPDVDLYYDDIVVFFVFAGVNFLIFIYVSRLYLLESAEKESEQLLEDTLGRFN
jgi:hypothetical protein